MIIIYQNLAYCRILHIWFILYIFNIVTYSPLLSFIFTFFIHLFIDNNSMTKYKKYGIILFDLIIIYYLFYINFHFTILPNFILFIAYILGLYFIFDINIIDLYTIYLKEDDIRHYGENYFSYMYRIWYYMFRPNKGLDKYPNTDFFELNKIKGLDII